MDYVAFLRARRVLTWYGSIVLATLLLAVYGILAHHGGIHVIRPDGKQPSDIPLGGLIAACAGGALAVAAFLAGGLDGEYKTAAIAFTRPIRRVVIAQRYALVAALAMLAAFAITLVAVLVAFAIAGVLPYVTLQAGEGPTLLAVVLGCAAMWYGLVVLAAALAPGRAGTIVGLSWAFALVIPALAHSGFPAPFNAIFAALQYLDPLAYVGSLGSSHGNVSPLGMEPMGLRAAVSWAIGLAALAIGTRIWAAREVPA